MRIQPGVPHELEHQLPMFLIKKILAALLLPPASLVLMALLGLWIAMRNTDPRRKIGIALAGLSLTTLLALSVPAVGKRMLGSLEHFPPPTAQQLAGAQAIVVLGGGLYNDAPEYNADTVNYHTLERLRYAARLAKQRKLSVLVAGGAPEGGLAEAHAMREALERDFGLSVKWTESSSRDTAENAKFSATQLKHAGITRIALVSHAWHMQRAVLLFEREGLIVIPAPTVFSTPAADPVSDWLPRDFRHSRIAIHEYIGLAVDRLRQWF